jgi:hypothetical protein
MSKPSDIDENVIDTSQIATINFWVARLEVTAEQLAEAVQAVGPQVEDVKRYLEGKAEKEGPQPGMLDSGFGTLAS